MELSDLPARELARLDAICLEFESRLRESLHAPLGTGVDGQHLSDRIETLVENFGGKHAVLLRRELDAIARELEREKRNKELVEANPQSTVPVNEGKIATHAALTQVLESETATDHSPLSLPTLGDRIGPYFITSVLGRGGMGIVYRATDTRLDRSVAIKMLSLHGRQSQSLIERFQREAKAVAGLTHPHIVELFDVGIYDGMPYVVMEHMRGETLHERMRSDRITKDSISVEQVRNWGIQLADALVTAHSHGVIHRDIKPENVMVMDRVHAARVGESDEVSNRRSASEAGSSLKLFDFGLSRVGSSRFPIETEPLASSSVDIAELLAEGDSSTRIGAVLGTPGYMAPEQARGGVITPAADIFSLGCVLFEAMFGRPAFSGETAMQRFAAVLEEQPLVGDIKKQDDAELSDLILEMLDKDPPARPLASDVLLRLQNSLRGSDSSDVDKGDAVVISRRRLIEMVSGAVIGGTIGATLLPAKPVNQLGSIRSIGVLRFQQTGASANAQNDPAIADQQLDTADKLSGLIAIELARLGDLTVPKYAPLTAAAPEDFRAVAKRLEVDALVSGTFNVGPTPTTSLFEDEPARSTMDVEVSIVSGATGKLIDGFSFATAASENLIEQTSLARKIAAFIDKGLKESDEQSTLKKPECFNCLLNGRLVSTPDSISAMESALRCFKSAASVDETYLPAQAGVALTAISLAARVDEQRAHDLIILSERTTRQVLSQSKDNRVARLARAMLDYQVHAKFESASRILDSLTSTESNQWQVYQQAAWLKHIRGDEDQAIYAMRKAVERHPTSWLLKTELARAEWFRGKTVRSIEIATRLLDDEAITGADEVYPRGLLIDIYEHSGELKAASKLDPDLNWSSDQGKAAYYAARKQQLVKLPYGPFGPTINAAILQMRSPDVAQDETHGQLLERLMAVHLPMLPLVLCKHPAAEPLTHLDPARKKFSVLK